MAQGIVPEDVLRQVEDYALKLFERGTEMARERGLILVDTKYEFGLLDGKVILIDEIHTPDSSRYFYADGYEERQAKGEPQRQLSKEFVRKWLMENGFMGKAGQKVPEMTEEYCDATLSYTKASPARSSSLPRWATSPHASRRTSPSACVTFKRWELRR